MQTPFEAYVAVKMAKRAKEKRQKNRESCDFFAQHERDTGPLGVPKKIEKKPKWLD